MAASVLKSRSFGLPSSLRVVALGLGVGLAWPLAIAGCDSRSEAMNREVEDLKSEPKEKVEIEKIPPHPLRDKLMPVLSKLYPLNDPPPVVDAGIDTPEGKYQYQLEAGVLGKVSLPAGLSQDAKVKAIVQATAEADAWAYRKEARRDYADLINRVKNSYGVDQRDKILKAYAELRMLQYFNGDTAEADVGALPADVKGPVEELRKYYVDNKEAVWQEWMDVKMYARRGVAGDEPFRSVLRDIKKELGQEEPPPIAWEDAMTTPQFKAWAKEIRSDEKLAGFLLNMRDMREREAFLEDTHSLFVIEGSPEVPKKAKKVKVDPELGFGILREDLGGGFNELTYVFSKKLKGAELRKTFLRALLYGHMLTDFQMLATAGSDYAERNEDNAIDPQTAVVPDKYDPLYARCGSAAGLDTFINNYGEDFEILKDLPAVKDPEKLLETAHECVIEGARGDVYIPREDDDKDVEGPAPGSRLALYQMMARFENMEADVERMGQEKRTAEDDVIDEGEAILQKIREKENAGKGVK